MTDEDADHRRPTTDNRESGTPTEDGANVAR